MVVPLVAWADFPPPVGIAAYFSFFLVVLQAKIFFTVFDRVVDGMEKYQRFLCLSFFQGIQL
jgi:hypothetical protein